MPLVPCNAWVGTLNTQEAHEAIHEGVAGTLLRVRSKARVVQGLPEMSLTPVCTVKRLKRECANMGKLPLE